MKLFKHITCLLGVFVIASALSCKKSKKEEVTDTDKGPKPATEQKEHWLDHSMNLTLAYYDQEVAVYKDDAIDANITWPYKLMSDVWKYSKKNYGQMGDDQRLYVILHGGAFGLIGQPVYYFDTDGDHRNIVDVSTTDWNNFIFPEPALIHETCHVVESVTNGIKGSPAFEIWGDSKWQDIFIYDLYRAMGMKDKVDAWYNFYMTDQVDYPRKGTYWFRDWWLPIYTKYGEGAVLNKFFVELSKNFPTHTLSKWKEYDRRMNLGEFVHFWSGAAGVNLKPLATKAWGWTDECEQQFNQAKIDFPNVKYTN